MDFGRFLEVSQTLGCQQPETSRRKSSKKRDWRCMPIAFIACGIKPAVNIHRTSATSTNCSSCARSSGIPSFERA